MYIYTCVRHMWQYTFMYIYIRVNHARIYISSFICDNIHASFICDNIHTCTYIRIYIYVHDSHVTIHICIYIYIYVRHSQVTHVTKYIYVTHVCIYTCIYIHVRHSHVTRLYIHMRHIHTYTSAPDRFDRSQNALWFNIGWLWLVGSIKL